MTSIALGLPAQLLSDEQLAVAVCRCGVSHLQ